MGTGGSGGSGAPADAGTTPPVSTLPPGVEPCVPTRTLSGGQSGNFDTMGPFCFRTPDEIEGWGCSNLGGRTLKVNGVMFACGTMPLPAKIAGHTYFEATAGEFPWASIHWWGKFVGVGNATPSADAATPPMDAGAPDGAATD